MRGCLLSVAVAQPVSVMCSLRMLIIAAGVACLFAHSDAELRASQRADFDASKFKTVR